MKVIFFVFALIGASCVSASLRTDFDELEAMIPVDQIIAIAQNYKNDPDIVRIIAFMKSDDFKKIGDIVVRVPEVRDMVNYLESKGLKPIEYINKFADLLGLPHWPENFSVYAWPGQNRSLRQMLDEIEAVIPTDQITEWALDKLMNSADFQELFEKIQNLDYKHLESGALSHPEIVKMLDGLKDMGVDVDKIWATIKEFLGWE